MNFDRVIVTLFVCYYQCHTGRSPCSRQTVNSDSNLPVCSFCPSLQPSCLFTYSPTKSFKPKDLLAFSHIAVFCFFLLLMISHRCQQDPKNCQEISGFTNYVPIDSLLNVTLMTFVTLQLFCLSIEWGNDWCVPRQPCWVHGSGGVLHVLQ